MSVAPPIAETSQQFAHALAAHPELSEGSIGLAVSGGGDSIALMQLAARRLPPNKLFAITVDHGLRREAADEVALVAEQAEALGVKHDIARWQWDGQGNLQAAAREGRWAAIRHWALTYNLRSVWLGHTEDDQVETVLMRLARGSGIDGLTAMYPTARRDGLRIFRPLLGCTRAALRDWLKAAGVGWCEDPSNDDPRFDRVRARQMLTQLCDLGLTRKRLLQTVDHMQAAHLTLQHAAKQFAQEHVRQDAGDLIFSPAALALDKADAPRRVMAAGFGWVSGQKYRPRFEQLRNAAEAVKKGQTVTLGGCLLAPDQSGAVRVSREAAATRPVTRDTATGPDAQGAFWDARWFIEGPTDGTETFKALGEGIKAVPDWRNCGVPRASLLASPSVWRGSELIAAPLAGLSNGWSARIVADFHSSAFAIED